MNSLTPTRAAIASLIALLMLPACGVPSEDLSPPHPRDSRVDALFAKYEVEDSPGATVLVVQRGEIIHAAGYGLANLATGQRLEPHTPVRLGSLGKAFMAMGIMILADRDSLRYDDLAVRWLPEISRFPGITVRHLLTHTSGTAEYYVGDGLHPSITDTNGDSLITNAEAAAVYETWGERGFAPGDSMRYSNSGYELLSLIIERASGMSTRDFLRQEIFEPLRMSSANVRDLPTNEIPMRAIGYTLSDDSTEWVENDYHKANWLIGAGGVYASIADMYLWDQALYGGDVFSVDILQEAFSPQTLTDGSPSQYGFGWGLSDRLGHKSIRHTGGWVGFVSAIWRFPDDELTVVILTNSSARRISSVADGVASIFLGLD